MIGFDSKSKQGTAAWMGYDTVEAMDRDHDPLHRTMAQMFNVQSYSMAVADNEDLPREQQEIAWAEENAVIHTQRWLRMIGHYDG